MAPATLTDLAKKAYFGQAYDEAVAKTLEPLAAPEFPLSRIKHFAIGELNPGYEGGGHIFEHLQRKIVNGVVEARKTTGESIKSLYEVKPEANGVRRIQIKYTRDYWKTQNHSVFPEGVTSKQVRDAAIVLFRQGKTAGISNTLPGISIDVPVKNSVIWNAYPSL